MVKRALGRGLGALIDDAEKMAESSWTNEVELSQIEVNPFQPRSYFDDEALRELAESIKEIGLIQPLTLRKTGDNKFQIIAGERRFRAAQMAGLTKVPAYVREANDEGMLEMALVENIQREDLDAIEIAFSYQRLIEECNLTQETLSTRVGKKRSTIANYMRLLRLPAVIQKGIREKQISMGHARALINIENHETQVSLFDQIVKNDYSVRKVEELVRNLSQQQEENTTPTDGKPNLPENFKTVRDSLTGLVGSPVKLTVNNKGKGKIVIPFKSDSDLQRIISILGRT